MSDFSDFESDMSFSSDDDIDFLFEQRRSKSNNYLEQTVPNYDDKTFLEKFCVTRETLDDICQKYEESNFYNTKCGQHGNISARNQVLIALWYIGHQTVSFRDVGVKFDVAISSIYRILRRVIFFISNLAPQIIKWPTENEKQISEDFFSRNGFPGVIGVIDGTHIKIDKPDNDSDSYVNKRGYYSIQVLIALWYIGHQTVSFRDVGVKFDVAISSIYRILRRVIFFISNLAPQIIKWPTENEKQISEDFFSRNGFPGVIGVIDGTHIKIDKPDNDSDSYVNKRGYYSIQAQVVCDHKLKIIDVFVGYPGSVNDNTVFTNSSLFEMLEEKCGDYLLLADYGFPLKINVTTPFIDTGQLTDRQINYNVKLSKNVCIIQQCIGLLKQKFRQLYHIKLRDIVFIVHVIRAACVLHNIALNHGTDREAIQNIGQLEVANEIIEGEEHELLEDKNAQIVRNRIVKSLRL